MKGEEKMNQTPNYNFNVPVGSDVVNPLVQDFPNWTSLDAILRNVANTGITTATHTKTGTIHTLTFSESTVPMIRFQATADFNTNDTFTVNGLSVSALTVAGESLPDGAFVIGSMVLCELRDNLLTIYTSGSDASTLEGHPASYFATDSDLQTVDDKTDANKVLIDQLFAEGVKCATSTFNVNLTGGTPQTLTRTRAGFDFTDEDILLAFPSIGDVNGLYETVSYSYSFYQGKTNPNVCGIRLYSPTNVSNVPVTIIALYK